MFAISQGQTGSPDGLVWAEMPDPVARPDEVLLEVAAAGVNRADLLQSAGHYPPPPGASPVLGLEVSGRILALGADVPADDDSSGWSVGDEACALLAGGAYAERVAVPLGQLLPVPARVDLVTAAALPEALCTVWSNLVMVAGLRAGETVLVHGGAGGIGTAAIQVAAALGARVFCTAGSPAALAGCRQLGAELATSYRDEDFVEVARLATDGAGVDVVLDVMGASYLSRNLDVLADDGRLVVVGLQGGIRAELDLSRMMSRRLSLFSTTLRARPKEQKAQIVAQVREHVWPMVEAGRVRPVVEATFAMPDAADAHRALAGGGHVGKLLLVAPGGGVSERSPAWRR